MKNYNEQIVRYIDGQLTKEEEREFEKKLRIDEALRKAYEEFQQVNELISKTKIPEVSGDYFYNVVPRFRQSLNANIKVSPFKKVSYAFVTLILFISSYFIFLNQSVSTNPENSSIESITKNISDDQINDVNNYFTDNSWIMPSEDIVYNAVNEDDFDLDGIMQNIPASEELNVLNDYQINNIESFAGEDRLQQAYEELLPKEFY